VSSAGRGGFTVLVGLGTGIQHDSALEETKAGLAGLNFGVGGFLSENLALMFRISGTNVRYDFGGSDEFRQVSGVGGASLQYWLSNRVNVEAGVGGGFWSVEDEQDTGAGLILGTAATIFNRGNHNVQVGVEYAPAFTDSGTVHNIGITLGYQLF